MKALKFTKGDFFGGLTAGIVALPLALAFGVQSGLGAAAGLYGAIFLGFFASLFGGTPSQISGPTGPMTVVSAAVIASMIAATGSLESSLGAIVACFILAGLFQVLMGILKIGSLIKYIPYPVISGFMSGIGVIIILLQVFAAIGQRKMAPYNPAAAPMPDCIPKASASGNATIPAVSPPKKSPLVNLKLPMLTCFNKLIICEGQNSISL